MMNPDDRRELWRAVSQIRTEHGVDDEARLSASEAFGRVTKKYQGHAQALDQELEALTIALLEFASTRLVHAERLQYRDIGLDTACSCVYELCSARGLKATLRVFPHAVRDLEPVMLTLASLDASDRQAWRTRYTLLLWLAMLAKNPFDVESVFGGGNHTFVQCVWRACDATLRDSGPAREAAALCLSSVLTRRDVSPDELASLVARLAKLVGAVRAGAALEVVFEATGTLRALAGALKTGERPRSRAVTRAVMEAVAPCFGDTTDKALRPLRKLAVKVVGRCGCALLKPRVAKWCYSRGRRTLLVEHGDIATADGSLEQDDDEDENRLDAGDDEDAAEMLEDVVDRLLEGYRDAETATRWTAAKAVARVAARLGQSVADDVVVCVLDDARGVTNGNDDASRHGACLALAELARLGVLLPERLSEAMDALTQSMLFDKRTASGSVGAHVRDAACYVAWAFARAYEPAVIAPYVHDLATTVAVVSIFDREIHVRRAASAALQENIGRQGHSNFPSGIELLSLADYFALGSRDKAYLEVAPAVFRLSDAYADAILSYIVADRLMHWDAHVRQLAARSLGAVVKSGAADDSARDKVVAFAVAELSPRAISPTDVGERHGALLGIAEAVAARGECATPEEVAAILPTLEAKRLFRGRGGELVRVAACRLVECLARCGAQLAVKTQLLLLSTLDDCAVHAVEEVRDAAVDALRQFCATYFGRSREPPSERLIERTAGKYIGLLESAATASISRGAARAVGVLPARVFCSSDAVLDRAIAALCRRAHRDDKVAGERDAETRRDALRALAEMCRTAFDYADGSTRSCRTPKRIRQIFETYIESCRDYGVDKRGDVGSWARVEGMRAAADLAIIASRAAYPTERHVGVQAGAPLVVPQLSKRVADYLDPVRLNALVAAPPPTACEDDQCWTPAMAHSLVDVLLRQLGEKLDLVRVQAEIVLRNTLCADNKIAVIPAKEALRRALFGEDDDQEHTATSLGQNMFSGLTRAMTAASTYHVSCFGGIAVTAGSADSKTSDEARRLLVSRANEWAKGRQLADIARLARAVISTLSDICLPPSERKDRDYDSGLGDDARHRAAATAAALSKEEATRAYVPLARVAASLIDSAGFRAVIFPSATPSEVLERRREQLKLPSNDDDSDHVRAQQAIIQDRIDPDDIGSLLSALVDTLVRIAGSRRCVNDVRRTCVVADALLATVSLCAHAPRNARRVTASVVALLGLQLPRARAYVAEHLYGRLVDLGIDGSQVAFTADQIQRAQDSLGGAVWDDDSTNTGQLRRYQDAIADQLGIKAQVDQITAVFDKRAARTQPQSRKKDELESYAALVQAAGY